MCCARPPLFHMPPPSLTYLSHTPHGICATPHSHTTRIGRPLLHRRVLAVGVRCFYRCVHAGGEGAADVGGACTPYGSEGGEGADRQHFLLSISRNALNRLLLAEMTRRVVASGVAREKGKGHVEVFFGHKLESIDLSRGTMEFRRHEDGGEGDLVRVNSQFIIGSDGCFSRVRQAMMRTSGFDFSQRFCHLQYKELHIRALPSDGSGGEPQGEQRARCPLRTDALHVWPRGEFLLLVLPNRDGSFAVTLFAPSAVFGSLSGAADVLGFFHEHFPEVVGWVGEAALAGDFLRHPVGTLLEIRCGPYHFGERVLVMGDSAHAMLPFMGQGTNCAFEDCAVLLRLLEEHGHALPAVLRDFTAARKANADALADLAAEHAGALAARPRWLERAASALRLHLAQCGVRALRPLYERIAFSDEPYAACTTAEHELQQRFALARSLALGGTLLAGGALLATRWCARRS
jgi:2-polyprenyl-6-methoxyphenol hydroxylase-like FAD-dependent oxidoreductase